MADCGELFRRRQEILERKKAMEDAASNMEARLSRGWTGDPNRVPDDEWKRASDEAFDYVDTPEAQEARARGMNGELPVNIGEGQTTNYSQLLAQVDVATAEDYAILHQMLVRTHQKIDPEDYAFVTQQFGRERILKLVEDAYEEYGVSGEQLGRLAQDVKPFLRLVDNMARLGAMSNQLKRNYLDAVGEVADLVEQGLDVPQDLRYRMFQAYKVAVVGERHFDLARRRTGQTLRALQDLPDYTTPGRVPGTEVPPGSQTVDVEATPPAQNAGTPGGGADIPRQGMRGIKGEQPPLPVSINEELKARLDNPGTYAPDPAEVEEVLGAAAKDVDQGSHVSQVIQAVAEAKGKPKVAARKIRQLKSAAELAGLRPQDRFTDDDWINHNLKYATLLAKDSMLLQLRSHLGLNVPSNLFMGGYGVVRQAFENVGLVPTYGTKLTAPRAMEAMRIAWGARGLAMQATVANARALYMDALMNNRAFFGNNQDLAVTTRPELLKVDLNEVEVARMRQARDLKIPFDTLQNKLTNVGAFVLKSNAAFRLFLHDQFGVSGPLLQPGLRNMVATDNVGGYFFYAFKLYNDLMMEARWRGPELGLDTPKEQVRWVQDRFDEHFIKFTPDAKDIAAYRKENGPLVTANMTDDQVADAISKQRVQDFQGYGALEYGIPRNDTPLAQEADLFSREMRFQKPPENVLARVPYGAMQSVRQKWWADAVVPFFQAPFTGGLFDVAVGTDPAIGALRSVNALFSKNMDPRQKARIHASWATGMTLAGLFLALDAADEDAIIGSGYHISDPREREEWESSIRAKRREPNTIYGIPVSGIPILNTLLLWKDMKEAGTYAALTKFDQAQWWEAQLGVLTGHLLRMTGIQQIQRIVQILTSTGDRRAEQVGNFIGFQAGSYAIPGIGVVRQIGALANANRQQKYRNRGPTPAEQEVGINWDAWERLEESLRNMTYGAVPFTQLFPGGVRKQKDHLGTPLRLPWGLPPTLWLEDRFSPQDWPEGLKDTYAQLDLHGHLRTPEPLFKRELGGARMNDELLEEYRTYLSETKGSDDFLFEMNFMGLPMEVRVAGEIIQEIPERGLRRSKSVNLVTVPLHSLLQRHIPGNTRLEAFTSLFSDPVYKAMMANPETTADTRVRDQTRANARRALSSRVVDAVDAYYLAAAEARVERSQTPAAADWKRRRNLVEAQRSLERGILEATEAVEVINGPAE